jgi:hypothetical protein
LLYLYSHPHQPIPYEEVYKIGKSYDIEAHIDYYDDAKIVKKFLYTYKSGMLPYDRPFTVTHKDHLYEAMTLFELFYHAKDFDTFYKTACWAREYINQEMFVYSFTTALLHRPDCKDFYIPVFYQIFPQYFFTDEVIDRAYKVQMQGTGKYMYPYVYQEGNVVYIESNYSNWYYNYNWEQRLTYFTEDIDWNAFYYNYHLKYPFWMSSEKYDFFKDFYRGSQFYFLHQQILARYYAERLSNGMGEIPTFSWEKPIDIGYDPYLSYPNGQRFPYRPNYVHLNDYYVKVKEVEQYEGRIREAIDKGYFETVSLN